MSQILVLGGGGREHALCFSLQQSKEVQKIWIAPGNPGIAQEEKVEIADVSLDHVDWLADFCLQKKIDMVIVGPEAYLADGITDALESHGIFVFGPSKKASELESSKNFAKQIMQMASLPTAEYKYCSSADEAKEFILNSEIGHSCAVKVNGLASGKGVIVCDSKKKALQAVDDLCLRLKSDTDFVIEEKLTGKEFSAFALCDGQTALPIGTACDYKRISEDLQSPNTGGMGTFAPCDWLEDSEQAEVAKILQDTVDAMKKQETPFVGFLFAGFMRTPQGLKLLEFNVRFGDPEAQSILFLLKSDLYAYLQAAKETRLSNKRTEETLSWKTGSVVHIVMAAKGYPLGPIQNGDEIQISSELDKNTKVFFAGVEKKGDQFITKGGRILGLSAYAETREQAKDLAYREIKKIQFAGAQFRSDIGEDLEYH